jgi:predicted nucleic acid-binding protein
VIFVDTSVWYAAADAGDRESARAQNLLASERELVTSDHVLVECWQLFQRRLGREAAETFWAELRRGPARIEPVTAADLEAAWAAGLAFEDQAFSLVDRTSFAVMERLGVDRVASFDAHFAVYRFGLRRERAFTIVR